MLRILPLGLLMASVIHVQAQMISVTDQQTGMPLSGVLISKTHGGAFVMTDAHGSAELSNMSETDTLIFEKEDYQVFLTPLSQLFLNGYRVLLKKTDLILPEIVVSAYREDRIQRTSIHIEPLTLHGPASPVSFMLTDALTHIPGVSQLSTGPGIAKPVIRGLYGNRILVLFSGLRFDNQQWQDEHGLGLTGMGLERVEIIKGPLSVLYGTEAVGGILNLIEESPAKTGYTETDVKSTLYSNTLGMQLTAGIRKTTDHDHYRLRVGLTSHADYSDGNNNRVLNSRFNGYQLNGTYGFTKKNWTSNNHYHFSFDRFGFIFDNLDHFFDADARWSRKMRGPHHIVVLNMLTSENRFQLPSSLLNITGGFQSNLRQEDEGGGELSLVMHLMTFQYAAKWEKTLSAHTSLVVSHQSSVENNTNYGKRKIVPDAWTVESTASGYLRHAWTHTIIEYGAGAGFRHIKTLYTKTVNSEEKDIDPFAQWRFFFNGMAGVCFLPDDHWNIKFNVSSGVRAPNLAELSSNGLHEGTYAYEHGDPDLDNEQNINMDAGIHYAGPFFSADASVFVNHFGKYIYLQPTGEDWFGFPVFRYRQADALLYGGEAGLRVHPPSLTGLSLGIAYSNLTGKLTGDTYLPYMPANKLTPELRYTHTSANEKSFHGYLRADYVFEQDKVYDLESPTPAYTLLEAGLGMSWSSTNASYLLALSGTNLLNEAYYDHLSRLKNFGILNMGRNITLSINITFHHKNNT